MPNDPVSRRRFLAALGALTTLPGCSLQPDQKLWQVLSGAEALWQGLLETGPNTKAKLYKRDQVSAEFPVRSLKLEDDYAMSLPEWELSVEGMCAQPQKYTLEALRKAFVKVAEVTRHDCVEGWSAIAEWGGVTLPD